MQKFCIRILKKKKIFAGEKNSVLRKRVSGITIEIFFFLFFLYNRKKLMTVCKKNVPFFLKKKGGGFKGNEKLKEVLRKNSNFLLLKICKCLLK